MKTLRPLLLAPWVLQLYACGHEPPAFVVRPDRAPIAVQQEPLGRQKDPVIPAASLDDTQQPEVTEPETRPVPSLLLAVRQGRADADHTSCAWVSACPTNGSQSQPRPCTRDLFLGCTHGRHAQVENQTFPVPTNGCLSLALKVTTYRNFREALSRHRPLGRKHFLGPWLRSKAISCCA